MIELLRYARVKPEGLVRAYMENRDTVCIEFKRFDPENGKEVSPERSLVAVSDLQKRWDTLQAESLVVKELLELANQG